MNHRIKRVRLANLRETQIGNCTRAPRRDTLNGSSKSRIEYDQVVARQNLWVAFSPIESGPIPQSLSCSYDDISPRTASDETSQKARKVCYCSASRWIYCRDYPYQVYSPSKIMKSTERKMPTVRGEVKHHLWIGCVSIRINANLCSISLLGYDGI